MFRVIKWQLGELMYEKRIGNTELAKRVGLTPNSISRLKRRDTVPRLDHEILSKLCDALDCNPGDLIIKI